MKKNTGRVFVRILVFAFLVPFLLLTLALLGYQLSVHKENVPDIKIAKVSDKLGKKEPITKAVLEDISKNLIYCTDDQTKEIEKITLEIFNSLDNRLYYITIPLKTRFTMSKALYQRLTLVDSRIPQVIKLSTMTKYFHDESVYDYDVLLVEDLLGIKISYYTAIPQQIYTGIFTPPLPEGEDSVSGEAFSRNFLESIKRMQTKDELKKYIKKIYPSLQSNFTMHQKMHYLDSYWKTRESSISFEVVAGEEHNSAYIVDHAKASQQIEATTGGGN